MKRIFILFSIMISLIFAACESNIKIGNNDTDKGNLQLDKIVEPAIVDNSNPYFFNDKDITLFSETVFTYKMETININVNDMSFYAHETEVHLSVRHLKELDNGNIYELKFKKPIETDLDEYRFNIGIFYVSQTSIYRLIDISYDKIEKLEQEHEILSDKADFVIVCQEEEIADDVNRIGLHNFLDIDGDIRIFRSYNNQVETGYYERLVWAKDLGLVGYLSGFGAENKSINITLDDIYKKYTSSTITW